MISLGLESLSLCYSNRFQRPWAWLNAALQNSADMALGDVVLAAELVRSACAMNGEGQGGDGVVVGHERRSRFDR